METLLEQIEHGKLWQFPGGIHPPEQKSVSNQASIGRIPLPDYLVLPLKQHIGANGQLLVNKGDSVRKGQPLTRPGANWSLPVHAPTSGVISDIKPMPSAHPSALPELSIVLTPDGEDKWCELNPVADYTQLDKQALIDIIHHAGIAGMGGAGFPTYVKADSAKHKPVEFLVVNGVECEPYITADDLLMREHAEQIVQGIEIMQHLLNPQYVLVGIETNKPEAIQAMTAAAAHNDKILVRGLPVKYPSGGEKQLIQVLTSKEVPSGGIPADVGVLVQNVGTLFAVSEAVCKGKPLIERVVTVTGNTIQTPQNVWALLGSEIKHLLTCQGFEPVAEQRVIMGGPMMGFTLPTVRIPVVKTTNCILAPDNQELAVVGPEQACIRCSACADACPQTLLPQQLQWFAKGKEYDKLEEHNLFDCIECGACAYVCPSEIPLVQYYRVAKAEIREQKLEKVKAERAKERFEARKERLEREQEERQNRHKRSARSNTRSAEQSDKVSAAMERVKQKKDSQSAVQAAIERAKAKKSADGTLEPDNSEVALERAKRKEKARQYKAEKDAQATPEMHAGGEGSRKDAVAAAIARAKAKKAAQQNDATESSATAPAASDDPRKAAVAAAIARAKAKKAAQQDDDTAQSSSDAGTEDPRKAAVAAAIARAKAKKAAKDTEQPEETQPVETDAEPEDPRKAAVAAAIARAKAKKAAKEAEQSDETQPVETDAEPEDPRKAAVAAAIARAKAKKAAKEAEQQADSVTDEAQPVEADAEPEDPRKAAVAAAIARAKAKKAAKEAEQQADTVTDEAQPAEADAEPEDPRKAAVAAAIARAKAKKAAKEAEQQADTVTDEAQPAEADAEPEDPRKAAVAAAIARAKAKKAAKEAEQQADIELASSAPEQESPANDAPLSAEEKRQAAIKAAVARAKAKKQAAAKDQEGNDLS
ncbi:electron transport complex subunit RsxC [Pseudoalteromonas rubra]|uniref:Ion-translocating oxidoreductase complex subunit C n=1 Tax=Pseudoalteromonas rubra TaxID=43658 RepID=A0A4Q7E0G7_9GAMM|nr:electron transport complex subunit RsxC [Pseudoalteromonas rubra]RZM74083.1 electron transport complex subunit RsxC [Pseudoalteromonas rubra]